MCRRDAWARRGTPPVRGYKLASGSSGAREQVLGVISYWGSSAMGNEEARVKPVSQLRGGAGEQR